MIKTRIKIGNSEIEDTFSKWGFVYLDADERTEAPIKKRESTSYAEEAGEHLDKRTVRDAFDYTIKFLIETPNSNTQNANAKIKKFNDALWEPQLDIDGNKVGDVRVYKEIEFYNDFNRVKIVGIPEPIAEPKEVYRRADGSTLDCVVFELKIRVAEPNKCDFAIKNKVVRQMPIQIALTTDGDNLYLHTSRELRKGEVVCLLRRGRTWSNKESNEGVKSRGHRRHKWAINSTAPLILGSNNRILSPREGLQYRDVYPDWEWHPAAISLPYILGARIKKAQYSHYFVAAKKGESMGITFGIAICDELRSPSLSNGCVYHYYRRSNVAFFRSCIEFADDLDQNQNLNEATWEKNFIYYAFAKLTVE